MKPDFVDLLACPRCESPLALEVEEEVDGDVRTGCLHCSEQHRYPIDRFVPRFVDSDRYADTFSKQLVTTRLPHSLLYCLCLLNTACFTWLPGGSQFRHLIRGQGRQPGTFWQHVLGSFDSLSPPYAHAHTPEEVQQWFADADLSQVRALNFPTAVTGIVE